MFGRNSLAKSGVDYSALSDIASGMASSDSTNIMSAYNEALANAGLYTEDFNRSTKAVINNVLKQSTTVDGAASSFARFSNEMNRGSSVAASLKNALSGIATSLLNMGLTYAISIGINHLVQMIQDADKSFEKLSGDLDESKDKYQATQSEIASVDSELESVNARIASLQDKLSTTGLTFVEEGELERLQAVTEELRTQKEILEGKSEVDQEGINSNFVKTINAAQTRKTDKGTGGLLSETYEGSSEVEKWLIDTSEKIAEAVTKTNFRQGFTEEENFYDAIERYKWYADNIASISSQVAAEYEKGESANKEWIANTETWLSEAKLKQSEYKSEFTNFASEITSSASGVTRTTETAPYLDWALEISKASTEALAYGKEVNLKGGIFNILWNSDKYKDATTELKRLAEAGELTIDTLSSGGNISEFFRELAQEGISAADAIEYINSQYGSLVETVESVESNPVISKYGSFDSISSSLYSTTEAYEKLKAAMDEQAESGTLSVATYKELIATNADFANYLVQTANGWALNTEAVNEYIEAQDATARMNALAAMLDLDEKIAEAKSELNDLSGDELIAAKDSITAMENEQTQLAYLVGSLDQAAGAYQRYLEAKKTANSSDLYDSSTSMYEEYKKTREQGRTGTDEFQASTEYILGKGWDKGIEDNYEARLQKYEEAEKKYERYFGQESEMNGAVNFLKDAADVGLASGNDVDGWILDAGVSMEELAQATGMSVDAVSALIGLMEAHEIDFGRDFEIPEETKQSVEEYTKMLDLAEQKRKAAAEYTQMATDAEEQGNEGLSEYYKQRAELVTKTAQQLEDVAKNQTVEPDINITSTEGLLAQIKEIQETIVALNESGISVPTELTGQYELLLSMLDAMGLYIGQDNQVHVKVNEEGSEETRTEIQSVVDNNGAGYDASIEVTDDGTTTMVAEGVQNVADSEYNAIISSETPDAQANSDALDAVANKERTAVIGVEVQRKAEEERERFVQNLTGSGMSYEGNGVFSFYEDGADTSVFNEGTPEVTVEPTIAPNAGEQLVEEIQNEIDGSRSEVSITPESYTPSEDSSTSGLADSINNAESSMDNLIDATEEFYGLVAASEEMVNQIGDGDTLELGVDFDMDIATVAGDLVGEVNELNRAGQGNSNLDKQSSDLQSAAASFITAYHQLQSVDPANEQDYAAATDSLRAAAVNFTTAYSALKSSIETIKPVTIKANTSSAIRSINALANRSITIQVRANVTGMPANAKGTRNAEAGLSLVDEKGAELIEHTSRGTFEMGTNNGARFTVLDEGDVVHTASETKSIIKRLGTNLGGLFSKGLNTAKGILSGGAFKSGLAAARLEIASAKRQKKTSGLAQKITQNNAAKAPKSTSKSTSKKKKKSSGGSSSSSSGVKDWEDYLSQLFDWIEVRLERLEQSTNRWIASAAEAIGYSLKNAQLESALSSVADQIDANTKAYTKYIEQADEVAKKLALSEDIIQKVKDGSIEIASYDEDTQKKINAYKEWYDKAVDCKDALHDLREQEQELAGEKLDNILNHYQWRIDRLDAIASSNDALIDLKNATGAEIVVSDYDKAIEATRQKIDELSESRIAMAKEFASLVERGLIAEGTEAWNDYTGKLEDLNEEIINTRTDLQKLNDSVSKITITNLKYSLAYLESIAQKIDGMMALHEAQGSDATDSDYESLIKNGMQQIQNLEAQNDEYRKQQQGLDVLSEKYQELQDNIDKNEKAILDMKTAQEEWNDSVIDNRIKEIQDYQEELQKSNDKLQRQKELQQAIEDLERARTQRNKRVFRGESGFVYEADQDAIRSAQEKFDQTIHDETINKLDDIIDALEDFKDDSNVYDAMGNLLGKEYTLPDILDYSDLLSLSNGNNIISEAMKAAKDAAYQQVISSVKNTANNVSIGDITVQGVDDANGLAEAIVDQLGNAVLKEMYNRAK